MVPSRFPAKITLTRLLARWHRSLWSLLFLLVMALFGCATHSETQLPQKGAFEPPYFGVNLSGAEFNTQALPGRYDFDYTYPDVQDVDYFMGKGMTIFRLPFRWERIQHETFDELNQQQLQHIDRLVRHITAKGALVILDPHNFARYYGNVIGEKDLPISAFADLWTKLARHYKNNPNVLFGLMNEPSGMSSELWLEDANAAIAAIRATGANNLILVPGNGFSGASSWFGSWYGTPNAEVLLSIEDPLDHYIIEVHQYLDANSSGTSTTCVEAERLQRFTDWLKTHNKKAFLGEFGAADTPECRQALAKMLDHINANQAVWLGWTWWSAGPWWGSYPFSLQPSNGKDRPQMRLLEHYMQQAKSPSSIQGDQQ
ncbi:glycoside hydrolase family 5 protein [Vibrio sp. SM6]|uniref:Endoglucanase n=1 Tax=Vibrio agarilyticus TaxID=2726741 RepID=A0A7X8TQN8_9VIBR|nr:glycoside hydrolase family 5 protein [Vibrio agarilyticus]NLS12478.1 glycoside hydrolase family 5 protein [Vibrio agarilyticus]